jgi:mono/diheme cytochrome c family protein
MRPIGSVVVVAVSVAASAAPAQLLDPVEHGRMLVEQNCSACHAVGLRGSSPHRAAPPFRILGRSFDLDEFPQRLVRGLSATHPDMPEIKFTEDDARAVRNYLRTIQE